MNSVRFGHFALAIILVIGLIMFSRCSKNEETITPKTGTIIVKPLPDGLNAPWLLDGPGSYTSNGIGQDTLTGLLTGTYEIHWGDVVGWLTPADSAQILTANQTVIFPGEYTSAENDSTGYVTDFDGNVYQTVKIGDQWWMAQNLRVTHYRNGDLIFHAIDNSAWSIADSGAYCAYSNDSTNIAAYGLLYNWHAVNDVRNLAPAGWHVPTDEEWKQLELYLGMSQHEADSTGWRGTIEGGKLKETGTAHWGSPNTGATNESRFTAVPGGHRAYNGFFFNKVYFGAYWTSSPGSTFAWYRGLYYDKATIDRAYHDRTSGLSVRCVKD